MRYRLLGSTGLSVSEVSFGAGPVSALMTEGSFADRREVVSRGLELGVNWFDTAAGYGAGKSEANLGEVLASLNVPHPIHVATKVRLAVEREADLRPLIVKSVRESLSRLKMSRVTLLQLHNSITPHRGDEPTSITPEDVLSTKGVLTAFEELRADGLVEHFGLTGIGHAGSLNLVMQSARFDTIQAPFHLLNPTALIGTPFCFPEPDYGGFLRVARDLGMGLFAIRVYAAGALLCAPPSAHTLKTPFFPLPLYERDHARATRLGNALGSLTALRKFALRYVLSQKEFTSAILGFGDAAHVEDAVRISELGPLSTSESAILETIMRDLVTGS